MLYIYLNANWVKVLKLHRFLKTTPGINGKKKTIKTPINPNILVSRDHFELSTTPPPPGRQRPYNILFEPRQHSDQ